MDLFDYMRGRELKKMKFSPLASRLRPTTLDEVVGQEHIIGKGKLLYRAIKASGSQFLFCFMDRPVRKDNLGQGDEQTNECC